MYFLFVAALTATNDYRPGLRLRIRAAIDIKRAGELEVDYSGRSV